MKKCKLCDQDGAEVIPVSKTDNQKVSCRTCGNYEITTEVTFLITDHGIEERRFLLSGLTREANLHSHDLVITTKNIEELLSSARPPENPMKAMDRTLLLMKHQTPSIGEGIRFHSYDYPVVFAKKKGEFSYILSCLCEEGLVENPGDGIYRITLKGWRRLEDLNLPGPDGNKAFVAMWFNDEIKSAWSDGFEPALKEVGYDPIRIDVVQHNEKIDDLIIDQIRQSVLLVADFTGHRGGVYFEAGFAMGIGIPVIWTCKSGHENELHFDTRQYNHIVWTDVDELKSRLVERIGATVGRRV